MTDLGELADAIRADWEAGRLPPGWSAGTDALEPGVVARVFGSRFDMTNAGYDDPPGDPDPYEPEPGPEDGGQPLEFASALTATRESVDLAYQRDQERAQQDTEPLNRTTEARLMRAFDRIAAGTYAPASFEFSGASSAGRALAEHRWGNRPQADSLAGVTGAPPCGVADAYGRCGEPYHTAGCGSTADPSIARELIEGGAYADRSGRTHMGEDGRTYRNQWGTGMDLTSLLEASTGQRLAGSADGLWESGHGPRELLMPQRTMRFGDIEDPDAISAEMPAATRRTAHALAAQAGLVPGAGDARRQAAAERDRRIASLNPGLRHPDSGESTRERAARMHRPVTPVRLDQPQDGLHGAQPQYMAGQL